jgi:hypothetical protein
MEVHDDLLLGFYLFFFFGFFWGGGLQTFEEVVLSGFFFLFGVLFLGLVGITDLTDLLPLPILKKHHVPAMLSALVYERSFRPH